MQDLGLRAFHVPEPRRSGGTEAEWYGASLSRVLGVLLVVYFVIGVVVGLDTLLRASRPR